MHLRYASCVWFALLTWSACVHAEDQRSTMYLSVDVGRSSVSSHVYESKNDPVYGFALGYTVAPNASVEVFWRSMSFRMFDWLAGDDSYYPSDHLGVAVVGGLPLGERTRVLGRLGVGRTTMESAYSSSRPDQHKTEVSVGAGVAYDFAERWALKLTVTRFTDTKVTTSLAGLDYRF